MLHTKNIVKRYNKKLILDNINLIIKPGDTIAITGASGIGKSTLLYLIGLFVIPDEGEILINNSLVQYNKSKYINDLRSNFFGFVYQDHYLLNDFTVLENIMLPQLIINQEKSIAVSKAMEILEELNIQDKAYCFPQTLSGGEQQRVSFARAIINNPKIILADEPTGNLDKINSNKVCDLLLRLARTRDTAIILITHDLNIALKMKYQYRITLDHNLLLTPSEI